MNEIPKNWQMRNFEDCLDKSSSASLRGIPQSAYKPSGKYPVVDQGEGNINGWTDDDGKVIHDFPVIVFGDHTRRFKYVDFPFVPGADGTKILRPKGDEIHPAFFFFQCLNFELPNKGYNRHYRYLKEVEVTLPPLPEQWAVAATFRAVQEAGDARRRELAAERERKAALMEELFTGGVHGEVQKETEIGPLPQGWKSVPIRQIGRVITGKTPPTKDPENWGGNVPFVTPGELFDGVVRRTERYVSKKGVGFCKLLPQGAVLVSCIGYIGKTGILAEPSVTNQQINAVTPLPSIADAFFLMYAFIHQKEALQKASAVTTIPILNKSNFEAVRLVLPPLSEQKDIAAVLTACDGKIAALEAEVALHDELFRALLDELLSGRVSTRPLIEDGVGEGGHA